MRWFGKKGSAGEKLEYLKREKEAARIYLDIERAKAEWERAVRQFEEAQGEDEIDYAIFVLEAAERKYQIHLKRAKQAGVNGPLRVDREMSV